LSGRIALRSDAPEDEPVASAHHNRRATGQLAAALDPAASILSDKDQLMVADILALRCVVTNPCPTPG
jgi:hypothetical protein